VERPLGVKDALSVFNTYAPPGDKVSARVLKKRKIDLGDPEEVRSFLSQKIAMKVHSKLESHYLKY